MSEETEATRKLAEALSLPPAPSYDTVALAILQGVLMREGRESTDVSGAAEWAWEAVPHYYIARHKFFTEIGPRYMGQIGEDNA